MIHLIESIIEYLIDATAYALHMIWIFAVPAALLSIMTVILIIFTIEWLVDRYGTEEPDINHFRRMK